MLFIFMLAIIYFDTARQEQQQQQSQFNRRNNQLQVTFSQDRNRIHTALDIPVLLLLFNAAIFTK